MSLRSQFPSFLNFFSIERNRDAISPQWRVIRNIKLVSGDGVQQVPQLLCNFCAKRNDTNRRDVFGGRGTMNGNFYCNRKTCARVRFLEKTLCQALSSPEEIFIFFLCLLMRFVVVEEIPLRKMLLWFSIYCSLPTTRSLLFF